MSWQPRASLRVIRERARIYRQIRTFFSQRGYLEVDTPLLMSHSNPDPQISSLGLTVEGRHHYLQTSPEFAMKRLLAAGSGSIFQICHAFREGEAGRRHHPEFSLLEWYSCGYDYRRLMHEMELLITTLSLHQCQFSRISYHELFRQHLDVDIDKVELDELRELCRRQVPGCDSESLDFDQCLDMLLAISISPAMRGYQFVYDYPASQAALARVKPDNPLLAERFELFFDGIELANGFSELTDAVEQRRRFEADNTLRQARGLPELEIDGTLLAALESGIEDCAGVALGLDRLLMVLLDLDSIDQVLTFTD